MHCHVTSCHVTRLSCDQALLLLCDWVYYVCLLQAFYKDMYDMYSNSECVVAWLPTE